MDFRLAQIVAAIEKFDYSVSVVFSQSNEGGYQSSIIAVLDLFQSDAVLRHISSILEGESNINLDKWLEENAKPRGSMLGSGSYKLPDNTTERIHLIKKFLMRIPENGENFVLNVAINWYPTTKITQMWDYLMNDFLKQFHRDVRNILIDLRVEAELSEKKQVSENMIINILQGGGNIQNIQGDNNTDITQTTPESE